MNQARTPTERFEALCELLDVARDMAPRDSAARQRRERVQAARERNREQWREQFRQFLATQRAGTARGV